MGPSGATPDAVPVTTVSQSPTHPDIYGFQIFARFWWNTVVHDWPPGATHDEAAPLAVKLVYRAPAGSGAWTTVTKDVYNPAYGHGVDWRFSPMAGIVQFQFDVIDINPGQTSLEFYLDTVTVAQRPDHDITVNRGAGFHWLSEGRVFGKTQQPFAFDLSLIHI